MICIVRQDEVEVLSDHHNTVPKYATLQILHFTVVDKLRPMPSHIASNNPNVLSSKAETNAGSELSSNRRCRGQCTSTALLILRNLA